MDDEQLKPISEVTSEDKRHIDLALRSFANASSWIPDNEEYKKVCEHFMRILFRNYGYEVKEVKHTDVYPEDIN